jgi:hypothetical protein
MNHRSVSADERIAFNGHMFSHSTDHEYVPCENCGTSLSWADRETHVCDAERRARFQTFQVRHELAAFDRQLDAFFETPTGRFAVYYAERDRLGRAA